MRVWVNMAACSPPGCGYLQKARNSALHELAAREVASEVKLHGLVLGTA